MYSNLTIKTSQHIYTIVTFCFLKVKDIIRPDITRDHPGVVYVNFPTKSNYIDNARKTLLNYRGYFVGRAGKILNKDMKRAMAMISLGL